MDNSRGVRYVILFSGFMGLLSGINRFLVPIALIQFGWNLADYALVYLFQAISMGIPFIFGGFLSDLRGRRQTIGLGFGLFGLGAYSFIQAVNGTSLVSLVLAQMLVTVSFGLGRMGLSTLMVDLTQEGQDRTENMGKAASLQNFSSFIGPILVGLLIAGFNGSIFEIVIDINISFTWFGSAIESSFITIGILGLFGVSSLFILPKTSEQVLEANRNAKIKDFTDSQKQMQGAFLLQEIIIGVTSGAIVPFIDYYILTTFNPSEFTWGLIFGLSNSTIAIGSLLVGKYSEGFGKGITIVRLNALAPLLALGIALSPSLLFVGVFYVLRSGVANSIHPAWQSWYFSHTLISARGRAFSVIQISRRLARAGGVALGPILFSFMGPLSFPVSCLFYPIAMMIPYRVEKSLPKILNSIQPISG